MEIPQTSFIVAFLVIGFVVFITIRGELTQYKAAIFGASTTTPQAVNTASTATSAAAAVAAAIPMLA